MDKNDQECPAGEGCDEGVTVPEELQQATHALMQKATTKHHLNHISDRVRAKRDEMYQAEEAAKNKKGGPKPSAYSTEGMPS